MEQREREAGRSLPSNVHLPGRRRRKQRACAKASTDLSRSLNRIIIAASTGGADYCSFRACTTDARNLPDRDLASSGTDYVALELELESGDYPGYRATLKTLPEGQVVWRSRELKARGRGDGKVVGISLRPGLLKSPTLHSGSVWYLCRRHSSEIIGSYPFQSHETVVPIRRLSALPLKEEPRSSTPSPCVPPDTQPVSSSPGRFRSNCSTSSPVTRCFPFLASCVPARPKRAGDDASSRPQPSQADKVREPRGNYAPGPRPTD